MRCDGKKKKCPQECIGPRGRKGPQGEPGEAGPQGEPGAPGGFAPFADFFALGLDNFGSIPGGSAVEFPQDGETSGAGIVRSSTTQFVLPELGFYLVFFQASVSGQGQLQLELNGVPIANSVVGRNTEACQIISESIVKNTVKGALLRVINPPGNAPLSVTHFAGGFQPTSAHLVITQVG